MIAFSPVPDDDPLLKLSPLLRGALLTLDHIETNGPIGLTPLKALKRYFVHWAAGAFEWPHYTAEGLYAMNKVLNEHDFLPLLVLHDVMVANKLVRHFKGALHITQMGKSVEQQTRPTLDTAGEPLSVHLRSQRIHPIERSAGRDLGHFFECHQR